AVAWVRLEKDVHVAGKVHTAAVHARMDLHGVGRMSREAEGWVNAVAPVVAGPDGRLLIIGERIGKGSAHRVRGRRDAGMIEPAQPADEAIVRRADVGVAAE